MTAAKQRRKVIASAVLGIVIPTILLRLDPFVLGGQDGDLMVGNFSHATYVLMLLTMVAFLVQTDSRSAAVISVGDSFGRAPCGVADLRRGGDLILPLSVVGIQVYGIGLLGFYPFVTAFSI